MDYCMYLNFWILNFDSWLRFLISPSEHQDFGEHLYLIVALFAEPAYKIVVATSADGYNRIVLYALCKLLDVRGYVAAQIVVQMIHP